ncbi:uncharacterized protein LOC125470838 [Pyrus x bretschneideri]|uniref:uncharacterized protein LOC125470838 n=1 Tax=Pyrus x bretschneideri TaxID=225117 RepID=UPI002030C3E5|nr:uncharacterized protein LOC125470838 [Pyrus x bretschneideri]
MKNLVKDCIGIISTEKLEEGKRFTRLQADKAATKAEPVNQMLDNGCSIDSIDEYCRLVESTTIENLKRFCKAIEAIYGATYLRKPNREALKRLLRKADKRGFPGMIGSLDCMHWEWKNCLTA